MTGIITLPLVPLRESNSERSEMTSQLLFGELVEIREERESWFYVCNLADNYTGWIDRKMIKKLDSRELQLIQNSPSFRISVPVSVCKKTTSEATMFLPGGSILYGIADNELIIADETYLIEKSDILVPKKPNGDEIIRLTFQYLNAPYLWGGKSVFGIDCSGLVQIVFSIYGIQLLRDASQQVDGGVVIDFLAEVKAGDLAFFENANGKIIHVGILLNSHQIIHASGCVKIDNIDSQGIISTQTGEYSHKLRVIKRLINGL